MVIMQFEEIETTAYKRGKCISCRKNRRRQLRIYETLNPWNKNENGSIKSREQIWKSVHAKVQAWQNEPLVCASCEAEAGR